MGRRHAMWRLGGAALAGVVMLGATADAHRRPPYACLDPDDCDIPWAWDDNPPPPDNPPYPQGFMLSVQVPPSGAAPGSGSKLERYPEVAEALGRCWDPSGAVGDRQWGAITLRVSFKRDGSINGEPRITYVDKMVDKSIDADLRRSLLAALARCTPLPFSPGLGNAIAGQIFSIRFIQKGHPI